jgi:uncharacterized protein YfiM (DUF2279 family)
VKLVLATVLALHAPSDGWPGFDKIKHFFVAAFVQSVAYSVLRTADVEHEASLIGASVATASLAIGKELHDRASGTGFSAADLAWGAGGAVTASVVLSGTRR